MNRKHFMLLLAYGLILIGFLTACGGMQAVPATSTVAPTPTVIPIHPGTIAFDWLSARVFDDIYLIQTDGTGLTRLTETNTSANSASWSPDGSRVAYDMCPKSIEDPDRQYDIWVMNADGSEKKQLTHGPLGGFTPAWSPDGTQIAYSTWFYPEEKYGPAQIYVMNADGSNPQRVTNGPANDMFPQWTPDGKILFLRREHGCNDVIGDVYSVNPDGSGLVRMTNIERVGGFSLSPDGTKLAIHNLVNHKIEVLPVNTSGLGTPTTLVDTDFGYTFIQIAWSPDGEALALALHDLGDWVGNDIYIVNADGSGLTTIPNIHSATSAAWKP